MRGLQAGMVKGGFSSMRWKGSFDQVSKRSTYDET
jgi:hypothetical protein